MEDRYGQQWPSVGRGTLTRSRPSFLTRTASDDAAQLLRRHSLPSSPEPNARAENVAKHFSSLAGQPSRPAASTTAINETSRLLADVSSSPRPYAADTFDFQYGSADCESKEPRKKRQNTKIVSNIRPVGGTEKLDTFSGVFVPTSLNVLSILMFIRFGFILGQVGLLGMLVLLIAAYTINLFTTMSISAVASNGTVRGGGAYYLISRSLGPEFGGSIGIVSYLGFVFNTGMNAVGLVDCLIYNFGSESGVWATWLPETDWYPYLWSTIVVVVCVVICLAGSALFARASNALLLILLIATFSIPVSAVLRSPFDASSGGKQFTVFTGLNLATLKENLLPNFTRRAAGSMTKGKENWSDMFGILFPATGGIFAGASMSGDLKNPSKSIPRGTLYGILLTFLSYALVVLAMSASITRSTFHRNVNVVQDVNLSGVLVLLGEISTTFFSVLMGIVGPAKQLQAMARDGIFPGLTIFGQGTKKTDDPLYAIMLTWLITQVTIVFDINSLASLVTMAYLMMNFALHLACALLKLSSAPNFRPSFRFFNIWTALLGAVLSVASMFFVDGVSATGSIALLILIFLVIHYTTPPKPWGSDVTSGLVYHQIRKYLLRLKTESVKYWRPQILLFVNDPRRGYKLILFANSLKKGGLFILGHIIVTDNFGASVPEARRQQAAWTKFIDHVKIKSFVNVAISPSMEWAARNIYLSAGLGGMRPNIVMMGFYNIQQFRQEQPLLDIPSPPPERRVDPVRRRHPSMSEVKGALPTDTCNVEKQTDMQSYVLMLEDLILKLQTNVAIAVGFSSLELPDPGKGNTKKYIDLWPIQMSAEIPSEGNTQQPSLLTTNFDTYTLILQLGCILNTVPAWKKAFKLRVAVFVEYESDVEEERSRVNSLLENLRIQAEVLVFWLACGDIKSYNYIVNGEEVDGEVEEQVNQVLDDESWWTELQRIRGKVRSGEMNDEDVLSLADDIQWPQTSFQSRRETSVVRFEGLRRMLQEPRRRASLGSLSQAGVVPSMRTHRLDEDLLSRHASHPSDSEGEEFDYDDSTDEEGSDDDMIAEGDEHSSSFAPDPDGDIEVGEEAGSSRISRTKPSSGKSSRKSSHSSKKSKGSSKRARAEGKFFKTRLATSLDSNDGSLTSLDHAALGVNESRGRPRSREDLDSTRAVESPSDRGLLEVPESSRRTGVMTPKFSAAPVPLTLTASNENGGPSIMFANQTHPKHRESSAQAAEGEPKSIYARAGAETSPSSRSASGYPAGASVPLSFNDLPCRAQHLVLNELMSQNNEDTAVTFTTLPAPADGTWKSETDSLTYLSDLEVLTQDLGPVLLVHSNSMTVTTNL